MAVPYGPLDRAIRAGFEWPVLRRPVDMLEVRAGAPRKLTGPSHLTMPMTTPLLPSGRSRPAFSCRPEVLSSGVFLIAGGKRL